MNLLSLTTTLPLLLTATGCCCICWFIRSARLRKSQKRITELENEMLTCHSEILKLHHEMAELRYEAGKIDRNNHLCRTDQRQGFWGHLCLISINLTKR